MNFCNGALKLSIFVLLLALVLSCAPKKGPVPTLSPQQQTAASKEAPQTEWEKTLQEAKKEGKVIVYASTGAAVARDMMVKSVREKYNIEVEMIVGRGAEISQKIFSERKAGLYLSDVYIGGITTIITVFIPAGVFDPMDKILILPEVYETRYWRGDKLPYFESGKYALKMNAQANSSLAINTSLVRPEEMSSYMDLLSPKLKGKIMMNDPSTTGNGQDFFYFVGMKMMGLDFMRQLAKQEPIIMRDQRLLAEWLARGKYAVATGPLPDTVLEYKKEGAPVMLLSYMKEGGYLTGGAGQLALMNKAPHPKAATIFINWLLSREGQTAWSNVQNAPGMRVDISTEGIEPSKVPDPKKQYFEEDAEGIKQKAESSTFAREIFNIK